MRTPGPYLAAIGLAAVILLLVSGCSSETAPNLSVSLFQNRADYATRSLQVEITNRGETDVVITAATFTSAYFDGIGRAGRLPYTLVAGTTTDFPARVPPPLCDVSDSRPSVTIGVKTTGGNSLSITKTPAVPFNSLGALHSQDCGQQAFERVATITPAPHLRFEQRDGSEIALLDFAITPTGAPGSVTLASTTGTTLLVPTEGEVRPLGLTFTSASAPITLTLAFVPARCGTHVISEDKIGTLIPFHAVAGQFSDAYFRVAVSPGVKAEFYDWVGRYCGQ
ncbi:MAG: hypothetical protein V4531_07620 [Actinomycetota bacterium]